MKHVKILMLSLGLLIATPIMLWLVGVNAQSFRSGDSATVPSGETVNSSLYIAGNTIDIAGKVNGDVFCAGQTVTISGDVDGDVICAAQTLDVSGEVTGDVRLAGQTVTFSGRVENNATVFAQTFTASASSSVGRDIAGGTHTATLNGNVGRDAALGATNLTINGAVGRNVEAGVTQLTLGSEANIGDNVTYTSENDLSQADGAIVGGEVTKKLPEKPQTNQNATGFFGVALFSMLALVLFVAMMLTSLVVALIIPQRLESSSERLLKSWPKTLLVGFLAHIIVPIAFVALLVSVVGIPLAIGGGLAWALVLFLSGPFSAYAVGRLILRQATNNVVLYMLLGSVVVLFLYWIPFVNILVFMAVGLFGVGMVVREFMPAKPQYEALSAKTKK